MQEATNFQCPNCGTEYKLVRVECPPRHDDPVTCLGCGGPLHNREGKFVLKYFRVAGSRRKARARKPG